VHTAIGGVYGGAAEINAGVKSGRRGNARLAPAFLLLNWPTRRAQVSEAVPSKSQ